METSTQGRLSKLLGRLRSSHTHHRLERVVVVIALLLFAVHLVLIAVRNTFPDLLLTSALNPNYLAALYTPFSVILVYEVYMMILALPLSFNDSIRKQYEIISLITVRKVFKDISYFGDFGDITFQREELLLIMSDLLGGLFLFLLVGVFHHISKNRIRPESSVRLDLFIRIKEWVAFLLLATFLSLSTYSILDWSVEVYRYLVLGTEFNIDLHLIFFEDFYTVMIFADVVILIASFLYTQSYSTLLRNAGFVASTIFLRISLAGESYESVLIAGFAILTGIAAQLVHRYFTYLDRMPTEAGGKRKKIGL